MASQECEVPTGTHLIARVSRNIAGTKLKLFNRVALKGLNFFWLPVLALYWLWSRKVQRPATCAYSRSFCWPLLLHSQPKPLQYNLCTICTIAHTTTHYQNKFWVIWKACSGHSQCVMARPWGKEELLCAFLNLISCSAHSKFHPLWIRFDHQKWWSLVH